MCSIVEYFACKHLGSFIVTPFSRASTRLNSMNNRHLADDSTDREVDRQWNGFKKEYCHKKLRNRL